VGIQSSGTCIVIHGNRIRTLAESPRFVLGHSFESVWVVSKENGRQHQAGSHHGDPTVGLITQDEEWFVTGGEGLQCYSLRKGLFTFFRHGTAPLDHHSTGLCWHVHDAKLEASDVVRVLIDPWSPLASVWRLKLGCQSVFKLADGPVLVDVPYRDSVEF
jgi:hypothetical protein